MGNFFQDAWDDVTGRSAAKDAERKQTKAIDQAQAEQRSIYSDIEGMYDPYIQTGDAAQQQYYQNAMNWGGPQAPEMSMYGGYDPFQFNLEADPGYQFAVDQATTQANREAAARGNYNSGNVLGEIAGLTTGMASQYANDAFNRQMGAHQQNYGQSLDQYGLDRQYNLDQYGFEQDQYRAGQDQMGYLGNLTDQGYNAMNNLANTRYDTGSNISDYMVGKGGVQSRSEIDRYNAGAGFATDLMGGIGFMSGGIF